MVAKIPPSFHGRTVVEHAVSRAGTHWIAANASGSGEKAAATVTTYPIRDRVGILAA